MTVEQHLGVAGGTVSVVKAWRRSQVGLTNPSIVAHCLPALLCLVYRCLVSLLPPLAGIVCVANTILPSPPAPSAFFPASCPQLQSYGRSYTIASGKSNPLRCVRGACLVCLQGCCQCQLAMPPPAPAALVGNGMHAGLPGMCVFENAM